MFWFAPPPFPFPSSPPPTPLTLTVPLWVNIPPLASKLFSPSSVQEISGTRQFFLIRQWGVGGLSGLARGLRVQLSINSCQRKHSNSFPIRNAKCIGLGARPGLDRAINRPSASHWLPWMAGMVELYTVSSSRPGSGSLIG